MLRRTRLSDSGAPPRALPLRWQTLTATARGAAHEAAGRPIQDVVACFGDPGHPGGLLALAVADGHGHPRHGRSATGAQFAVRVAGSALIERSADLAAGGATGEVEHVLGGAVIPAIIAAWRFAVEDDLLEHPLDQDERGWLRPGESGSVAYGTTLLLAAVVGSWLGLCQIGDGDIVVVDGQGRASTPVPGDERLDGRRTTSLCQPDAVRSFRCAVLDLAREDVAAVLLATDGFGNALVTDPWQQPVGSDLVRFARDQGIGWVRAQLPAWAAACASAAGSGDDTAVALLLRDEALEVAPSPPRPLGIHRPGAARE